MTDCFIIGGEAKVQCAIYGPSAGSPDLRDYSDEGIFVCDFKYAPFALAERRPAGQSDDERDLSAAITEAIKPSILLEKYPKSAINAFIMVLQNSGGVLAAAISCVSMALAHAGVECRDLVAACSAARLGEHIALDPSAHEEEREDAGTTVSYMACQNLVTSVIQRGDMPGSSCIDCIDFCIGGCGELRRVMRRCLLEKFVADHASENPNEDWKTMLEKSFESAKSS